MDISNKKQDKNTFSIDKKDIFNLYLCGPTVYDNVHIGNLRSLILFDIFCRVLEKEGIKYKFVHNLTDIDDKIIKKAIEKNLSESSISEFFISSYLTVLENYNIKTITNIVKVTDYIDKIILFINKLVEKDDAYVRNGEVFFNLKKYYHLYGKISNQDLNSLTSSDRNNIKNKLFEKDFVLWKKTEIGKTWDSKWGMGRPGWHTECVVFIDDLFNGKTIDIHGGGNDLIFPHHENENIQFLAINGKEISLSWLHVAHLFYNDEKMSKTIKNTILASNYYEKYGADSLRYIFCSVPYNRVIKLDKNLIHNSLNSIKKYSNLDKKIKLFFYKQNNSDINSHLLKKNNYNISNFLLNKFINTQKIIYEIDNLLNFINVFIDKNEKSNNIENCIKNDEFINKISTFYYLLDLIGFTFFKWEYSCDDKAKINNWLNLLYKKEFEAADTIRKELINENLI